MEATAGERVGWSDGALGAMWADLQRRIAGVQNPWIARLLADVVTTEPRLRTWPAAQTVHHAYRGGLLEHVLSLAALADACAGHYGVDRDLLLAGVVLHDIGKLDELAYDGETASYTRDGNLIGHIALGVTRVREAIGRIAGFPADLRARIEHMVVSHHGARQLGSPIEPMTEEAFILSALDDLDARLHQVRRHQQESAGEGEFTPYHPRLRRVLLKPGVR